MLPVRGGEYAAETIFLNIVSWAEEHRERFAPSCRETTPPPGGWWGRWDVAKATSHLGIFMEPLKAQIWEELLRRPDCGIEQVSEVLRLWGDLGLVKTSNGNPAWLIRTGDTTRRGVELSLLHAERLRQERTT